MPAQDSSIFSLADIAIEKLKAVAVIYKIAQTAGCDQTCVNNKFDLNARKKYLAAERRLFDVEVGSIGKNVMHYFLASRIEKLIPYVSSEDQYIFVSFYRKSISSILRRIKNK